VESARTLLRDLSEYWASQPAEDREGEIARPGQEPCRRPREPESAEMVKESIEVIELGFAALALRL
jgi:hypothetical protein